MSGLEVSVAIFERNQRVIARDERDTYRVAACESSLLSAADSVLVSALVVAASALVTAADPFVAGSAVLEAPLRRGGFASAFGPDGIVFSGLGSLALASTTSTAAVVLGAGAADPVEGSDLLASTFSAGLEIDRVDSAGGTTAWTSGEPGLVSPTRAAFAVSGDDAADRRAAALLESAARNWLMGIHFGLSLPSWDAYLGGKRGRKRDSQHEIDGYARVAAGAYDWRRSLRSSLVSFAMASLSFLSTCSPIETSRGKNGRIFWRTMTTFLMCMYSFESTDASNVPAIRLCHLCITLRNPSQGRRSFLPQCEVVVRSSLARKPGRTVSLSPAFSAGFSPIASFAYFVSSSCQGIRSCRQSCRNRA